MPGLSGEKLLDRLLTMAGALPVVVITGYGGEEAKAGMMTKGAVAFLTKPFDAKELLDAVEESVTRSQAAAAERGGT
jgi:two-component system response regulator GlrR